MVKKMLENIIDDLNLKIKINEADIAIANPEKKIQLQRYSEGLNVALNLIKATEIKDINKNDLEMCQYLLNKYGNLPLSDVIFQIPD